jgi:hypothetical protein
MLFHAKTKFRIDQAAKLLAIKALYNIYNVPGVYYCDKYEIIVYTQYAYYTIFIYTVYSLLYQINIFKLYRTQRKSLCLWLLYHTFDYRELYLDIILDHRVSAMSKRVKRFSYITVFDGLFTVGRACLEFTHSWRDHRIWLFYSNSTSLHEVNPLGLHIGQVTLQHWQQSQVTTISFAVRSIGLEDFYGEKRPFVAIEALMSTEIWSNFSLD